MNMRVRMLGGTQVGLRAHDASLVAAGARLARGAGARRSPALLRQLEHAQPREHRDGRGSGARGGAGEVRRDAARGRHPALGARRVPRGPVRGLVGELPLLRGAPVLRLARRGGPLRATPLGGGLRRVAHPQRDRAARAGADHPPVEAASGAHGPAPGRGGRRGARSCRGRGRERRLPARPGGLQHPARGGRGQLDAARRVRARQGGDPERRRGRRDALDRRPRRALRLDLLARQRVQRRRHLPRTCASAADWTTSARSP